MSADAQATQLAWTSTTVTLMIVKVVLLLSVLILDPENALPTSMVNTLSADFIDLSMFNINMWSWISAVIPVVRKYINNTLGRINVCWCPGNAICLDTSSCYVDNDQICFISSVSFLLRWRTQSTQMVDIMSADAQATQIVWTSVAINAEDCQSCVIS